MAVHLARSGHDVRLWMREAELVSRMLERRDNPAYLPGVRIPDRVTPVRELAEAAERADFALSTVPSQLARTVYGELAEHLKRARVWGCADHAEGQWVSRDHVVADGEIFELDT